MSELQVKKENTNAVEKQTIKVEEFSPSCDVEESKDYYMVNVDMPGLELDKIHVELDRDMLLVEGTDETEGLAPRHYIRQFRVIRGLDASRVQADYKQGVLSLRLPKPETQKPKQIKITCG